jgi:predicted nucleotidyltransferase
MPSEDSADAREHKPGLPPREKGIEDLDPEHLRDVVEAICDKVSGVQSMWVVGSFARGEARNVASDLDLRVVTPDEQGHLTSMKNDYRPPEGACFGFVDAVAAPNEPVGIDRYELEVRG